MGHNLRDHAAAVKPIERPSIVVYRWQAIATQDDYLVTIHNRQRLEHSLNSSHNKIWSFSNAMDHGPK